MAILVLAVALNVLATTRARRGDLRFTPLLVVTHLVAPLFLIGGGATLAAQGQGLGYLLAIGGIVWAAFWLRVAFGYRKSHVPLVIRKTSPIAQPTCA